MGRQRLPCSRNANKAHSKGFLAIHICVKVSDTFSSNFLARPSRPAGLCDSLSIRSTLVGTSTFRAWLSFLQIGCSFRNGDLVLLLCERQVARRNRPGADGVMCKILFERLHMSENLTIEDLEIELTCGPVRARGPAD